MGQPENLDPFHRLFNMYAQHGASQFKLVRSLLALKTTEQRLRDADRRIQAGGLEGPELERWEAVFSESDDATLKIRDEIKSLVLTLTGVSWDELQEANL
jgi:hypothetical protein